MSSRYAKSSKKTAPLIITITITLGLGLLLVYDATVFYSQDLYGNPYRFVLLQLVWVVVGSVGFILFYSIHYKKWYKFSPYIFGGAIATLSLLALFGFLTFQTHFLQCSGTRPFVPCINGAYRWLHINSSPLPQIPLMGTLGIQPAELVKLAAILYLSALLSRVLAEKQDPYKVFWRFLIPSGLVFGLVLLQPNMSTASLIFLICLSIYFGSGASLKPFIGIAPLFVILFLLAMAVSPYRRQRFLTLINHDQTQEQSLSSGYHSSQIMVSLGSGGFFGLGIGQSRQKYQYLPEIASDSIFAVLGEELGLIGTSTLLLLFLFLVYQGYSVASGAPDMFSRLLAVGVTSWMGLQFFINVAAMAQLIPLTGIPIPLVSYGGSSMVFTLCGLGLLANVSKYSS